MAGADDVRNGLSLCRLHHWAFDNMLLGISTGRMIVCPPPVAVLAGNAALAQLDGAPLLAPEDDELAVDDFAIGWAYERFDAAWTQTTSSKAGRSCWAGRRDCDEKRDAGQMRGARGKVSSP